MADTKSQTDIDIVIIGAGISGINAAYRIQTQASTFSYTILEGRNGMGGTWDFFVRNHSSPTSHKVPP